MAERSLSGESGRDDGVPGFSSGAFDFDAWHRLSVDDPARYFKARRAAIDTTIDAACTGIDDLRRLQDRIDALRASAGSPLKAAWQLTGLMQDNVDLLGHQLDVLKRETDRLRLRIASSPAQD